MYGCHTEAEREFTRPGGVWFQSLGGWRCQLVWRLFGVFVNQIFLLLHDWTDSWAALQARPSSFFATHAFGLLLIALGPRLLVLIGLVVSGGVFVWQHAIPDPIYQLAEEFLPLVALPLAAVVLVALSRPGREGANERIEAAHVGLFRVSVVVAMTFAAFHKFNADFFDPAASCAMIIPHRILDVLPQRGLIEAVMPYLGFLGEAVIPVLLLWQPRLGMPVALFVMSVIGHRGATPFTMLVMLLSLAFLRPEDRLALVTGWRTHWRSVAVVVTGAIALSLGIYVVFGTHRPWREFAAFELVILFIGACLVFVLAADARAAGGPREWIRGLRTPGYRVDPVLPRAPAARALLIAFAVAGIVNALTPYFGAKFRLSFAMFSNLRVDDDRWNHFVIPRAAYLREHDPYVHVTRVEIRRAPGAPRPTGQTKPPLAPSVLTPDGLAERVQKLRWRNLDASIELVYEGEPHRFERVATRPELDAWLAGLDHRSRLFQDDLALGDAQHCLH